MWGGGGGSNMGDTKSQCVCSRTQLPGRGIAYTMKRSEKSAGDESEKKL